jgi:hypothetical protein
MPNTENQMFERRIWKNTPVFRKTPQSDPAQRKFKKFQSSPKVTPHKKQV